MSLSLFLCGCQWEFASVTFPGFFFVRSSLSLSPPFPPCLPPSLPLSFSFLSLSLSFFCSCSHGRSPGRRYDHVLILNLLNCCQSSLQLRRSLLDGLARSPGVRSWRTAATGVVYVPRRWGGIKQCLNSDSWAACGLKGPILNNIRTTCNPAITQQRAGCARLAAQKGNFHQTDH